LRLGEDTFAPFCVGNGLKSGWAFDNLVEKVTEVDGSVLAAEEPARDTLALDILTFVAGGVGLKPGLHAPFTGI
jgi:hypothetical protein